MFKGAGAGETADNVRAAAASGTFGAVPYRYRCVSKQEIVYRGRDN